MGPPFPEIILPKFPPFPEIFLLDFLPFPEIFLLFIRNYSGRFLIANCAGKKCTAPCFARCEYRRKGLLLIIKDV